MTATMSIPFSHQGRDGSIIVTYGLNPGPTESGLDTIKGLGSVFDLQLCKMYPAMHARIAYQGTGIRTALAWIQCIESTCHMENSDLPQTFTGVDTSALLADCGVPFYSIGSLPEIYDSPCYNLMEGELRRI